MGPKKSLKPTFTTVNPAIQPSIHPFPQKEHLSYPPASEASEEKIHTHPSKEGVINVNGLFVITVVNLELGTFK